MTLGLSLVTPTYARDLPLFEDLHASLRERLAAGCEHVVIVPRVDQSLFAPFGDAGTRILCVEDVVPGPFLLLPRFLKLLSSGRDVWLSHRTAPVRGWIMQQIVKFAAADAVGNELMLLVDSDLMFTRSVAARDFVKGGRIRLYRERGVTGHVASHRRWYRTTAELLGVEEKHFFGDTYVSPAVSWSRSVVRKMLAHLEQRAGKPWWLVLANTMHFSEYILYGVYADHVADDKGIHFGDETAMFLNSWDFDLNTTEGEDNFVAAFKPGHIGAHIDSQLKMPAERRKHLLARVQQAAAQ